MLINFICSNFLSINEQIKFSLFKSPTRRLDSHVFSIKNKSPKMVKSAIIYGANAAGKTSLVKAIDLSSSYILKGPHNEEIIDIPTFKLNGQHKSSFFEYTFYVNERFYIYGFEVNSTKVVDEWCYQINQNKTQLIYEMSETNSESREYNFGSLISNSEEEKNFIVYSVKATSENQLLISTFTKIPPKNLTQDIKNIIEWFRGIRIIYPSTKMFNPFPIINNEKFLRDFVNILNHLGIDINSMKTSQIDYEDFDKYIPTVIFSKIKKNLKNNTTTMIKTSNNDYFTVSLEDSKININKLVLCRKSTTGTEIKFDLSEESDGTRRLLDLVPMLIDMKENNAIYIVDEIDRSFHTLLTKKVYELFFELTKNRACQLIATSHDTNLMDLEKFRDDEIWYVRKNARKESEFYCLYQFKQRYDKKIVKDYLDGRFEAIPTFNDSVEM